MPLAFSVPLPVLFRVENLVITNLASLGNEFSFVKMSCSFLVSFEMCLRR